jgi:hypothetical protein
MTTNTTRWATAAIALMAATGCGVSVGEEPNLSAGGGVTGEGGGEDATGAGPGPGSSGDADDAAADTDALEGSDGAIGSSTGGAAADETTAADESTGGAGSTGTTDDAGSTGDEGSTGEPSDGDLDDDELPDDEDPFPNDPNLPGVVAQGVVYAHTADTLFTLDVEDYTITEVGAFTFPAGSPGSVTDIAIDQWGVLYAITFDDLHACNPATAQCYGLADLPSQSNGATFVPPGTLDATDDTLIGIAITGDWRQMQLAGGVVSQMVLGGYGGGYTSSGDAFSIFGVGTYASVDAPGQPDDVIVEVDPITGAVQGEVATVTGYSSIYGLAGWQGSIFAFDASGAVLRIDPATGDVTLLQATPHSWWGAAVVTVLPS